MICICLTCGIEFATRPSAVKRGGGKYCSRPCFAQGISGDKHVDWKGGKPVRECLVCGKSFQAEYGNVRRGYGFLCSHDCTGKFKSENYSGSNSSNWKGGITPFHLLHRRGPEYKEWRESIFARDDWTCQECGERGGKLNAHHIFPFADFPEHHFALWNGITLCTKCHRQAHRKHSELTAA